MLRTLLSARFGLLVRREPSFKAENWVLRMARDDRRLGPGIRQAEMECIKTPENAPVSQRELRPGLPVPCGQRRDADIVAAGGVPFSSLLLPIQIAVGEEVIDRTGLTGLFDYYARLPRSATAGGGQQDAREASFFTALQEELGVRLEREEITREAIVIERVSRPSPN